ncbi:hypothetical protein BGZ63DRAFT_387163 [Mariannaea sp. PMI_226]|nr:hypothetical protein BGZ63DRAFT_387163 [Mariannaea sp. PMI_226]
MASVQEAEQIVWRQTENYGILDKDMMDDIEKFNSEYRRKIDRNWLRIETVASHSIKVLAKQIYGSGARFVFELLQNAEDNNFSKAEKKKAPPFISFKIYPDRIIVECNEDGFNERDIEAICAVGQSTKSAAHGYIGAKGIGFKSVFIAAHEVLIQSGNFSFKFQHKKTDPGIGMVRPIWVNPDDLETIPNPPLTRMTLYIHEDGDQVEIQHLKRVISMQFDDLRETCLLFLEKLQKVSVAFYDDKGELERSKQFRKHQLDEHQVSLQTTSIINGEEITKSQIYHITKQKATGLAGSDNREVPNTEDGRSSSSTAEVVLAFPLTSASLPLISRDNQDLFAFLPLRKSDYKFLIHSDFDTNASRQDIVTSSRRNLGLRPWIAEAFLKAVLQFCEHPTLCYHWPLFLPSPNNGHDGFWSGLVREIQSKMAKAHIMRSRKRNDLRLISDVIILTDDWKDGHGQPIFDDPIDDIYLSPTYPQSATNILIGYGLMAATAATAVRLLEADLRSSNPKMHGKDTSDEWHSAAARAISQRVEWKQFILKIRYLPLLPLREGEWTSITSGPVYFSATKNIDIPDSLNLRVIMPSASQNPDRKALFRRLGVSEATIDLVRSSILKRFNPSLGIILFRNIKSYLDYLYLTHQPDAHSNEVYAGLWVTIDNWKCRYPQQSDIYLPGTNHAYSPANLLAAHDTAPGLSVYFLHSIHMENVPTKPTLAHPSWERWLCDSVGIRERLRLLSRNGDALSDTFLYVFKHRPDKFLGLFEHLWLREKSNLLRNRTLRSRIEDLSAKDLCGVNFSLKLKDAWLPSKRLQESVSRYMENPEQFPFLKLEESDSSEQLRAKWNFLHLYFSVGKDETLEFLLEILRCIERSNPKPSSISQTQNVFNLYAAIYAKLTVAEDESGSRDKVKKFFYNYGIMIPDDQAPTWSASYGCLWDAPADMETYYSIGTRYSRTLDDEQFGNIRNLLQRTAGVRNASLHDLVSELATLRDRECQDKLRIGALYKYLNESLIESTSEMRAAFEASPLIYYVTQRGQSGWCKTSDSLWSSETQIRGKAILDECWEDEKTFFVDKLGVKLLTLQMVYDELRQSPQSSADEIKIAILLFNGLLQTDPSHLDPEPIRQAKIFPIRYPNGTVTLSSMDVDFAIGDRDKLKTHFQDKITLLDFDNLEDVRRLKPFFEWVGLQNRYLSRSVTERTSISSDSGRPMSTHNRDLKRKAYYIARVAATFNSPRFENPGQLYDQLRTMTVMEVDGISSVLEMSQSRQKFQVQVATANEHIDDTLENLTIYVPKDRRAQELCFGSVLPRKFAAWLMRHPISHIQETVEVDAVNALTSIFACEQSVLDDILEDQGIIQVSFENEDNRNNQGDEETEEEEVVEEEGEQEESENPVEEDSAPLSEGQMTPTHSSVDDRSSTYIGTPGAGSEGGFFETVIETISRQSHMSQQSRPRSSRPEQPQTLYQSSNTPIYLPPQTSQPVIVAQPASGSSEAVQYLTILNRVVETARRAAFPTRGAFDMSDLRDALPGDTRNEDMYESFDGPGVVSRFRSTTQLERDKKIGAAGELYVSDVECTTEDFSILIEALAQVFELLSQLEMPGWDRASWHSTIREYVTVHPDYSTLGPSGYRIETADLVYVDATGRLTNLLIDHGYLDNDGWNGARPKYYIEVKTTTGPCETPFYMSGKQYQLMGRIHRTEDRSEVYMIFRVFWVNSDRIGLNIYFDPEKLRQDGRLVFTGQTWAVTPGAGTEAND